MYIVNPSRCIERPAPTESTGSRTISGRTKNHPLKGCPAANGIGSPYKNISRSSRVLSRAPVKAGKYLSPDCGKKGPLRVWLVGEQKGDGPAGGVPADMGFVVTALSDNKPAARFSGPSFVSREVNFSLEKLRIFLFYMYIYVFFFFFGKSGETVFGSRSKTPSALETETGWKKRRVEEFGGVEYLVRSKTRARRRTALRYIAVLSHKLRLRRARSMASRP